MKSPVCCRNIFTVLILAVVACGATALADVNVTLDPAVQYQTILGWGAASSSPSWVSQRLRDAVIREAVNELGDPTHTVAESLTVTVYPQNPSAPVIRNVTASPATVALAAGGTQLSATASDPDGDPISCW